VTGDEEIPAGSASTGSAGIDEAEAEDTPPSDPPPPSGSVAVGISIGDDNPGSYRVGLGSFCS
jgi:hypothetical protein